MFTEKRYARLKWACRRGMLELDVLLQPFVEEAFHDLSDQDQETFERLLNSCELDDEGHAANAFYRWFNIGSFRYSNIIHQSCWYGNMCWFVFPVYVPD